MRNTNPWAALAVAVPLLLATATTSFATPQDRPAPQEQAAAAAATTDPADSPEDVSVILELQDQSQLPDPPEDEASEPDTSATGGASPSQITARVKDLAMKYLGTPYKWGGTTPAAFDCSGFTKYVLNALGVRLPRTARDQYKAGKPVSRDDLQPGDLVFFDMRKGYVSHVGLYLGDGKFIHASTPKTGVRLDKLDAQTYRKYFVGARRFGCA